MTDGPGEATRLALKASRCAGKRCGEEAVSRKLHSAGAQHLNTWSENASGMSVLLQPSFAPHFPWLCCHEYTVCAHFDGNGMRAITSPAAGSMDGRILAKQAIMRQAEEKKRDDRTRLRTSGDESVLVLGRLRSPSNEI